MEKASKILSYIFISAFFFTGPLASQENLPLPAGAVEKPEGFTIGLNLEGPIGKFFEPDQSAYSAVTHIKLAPDWFFRGEAGFENLSFASANRADRNYAYESKG